MVVILAVCDLAADRCRLNRGMAGSCWADRLDRSFLGRGFAVAFVALALGALCLLLDLKRPERFSLVLAYPTPTMLSFGSYALAGTLVLSVGIACLYLLELRRIPRAAVVVLEALAAVFGMATVSYTGLFFADIDFVGLWDNAALPVLFIASALSVGLTGALGLSLWDAQGRLSALSRAFSRAELVALSAEAVALGAYVAVAAVQGRLFELVSISLGPAFSLVFVGIIGFGLLVPLAIEWLSFRIQSAAVAALAVPCVVIGGFALRYGVVMMPLL